MVISSSAASQAGLQEATVAEAQYTNPAVGWRDETIKKKSDGFVLVLSRFCARIRNLNGK